MSLFQKIKKNWMPLSIIGAGAISTGLYYIYIRKTLNIKDQLAPIYPKETLIEYFEKSYEDISVIVTSLANSIRVRIRNAGMDPDNTPDSYIELIKREMQEKDNKHLSKIFHAETLVCNLMGIDPVELKRSINHYIEKNDQEIIRLIRRKEDSISNAYRGVSPPLPEEAKDTLRYLKASVVIDIFCSIITSNVHEMFQVCDEIKEEIARGEFDPSSSSLLSHPKVKQILEDISHVDEKPFVVEKLPEIRFAELAYHTKLNQICNEHHDVSTKIREIGDLSRMVGTSLGNGSMINNQESEHIREAFESDIKDLKAMGQQLDLNEAEADK